MEKNINVEEILIKNIKGSVDAGGKDFYTVFRDMWMLLDPEPSRRVIMKSIKEIVEAVIDQCAENAKAVIVNDGWPPNFRKETPKKASIDKQSILNVKNLVNYE